MSCGSCSSGSLGGISVGSGETVTELIKVTGLEEANGLLAEGYLFVSMYFDQNSQQEIYILGHLRPSQAARKQIGFISRD